MRIWRNVWRDARIGPGDVVLAGLMVATAIIVLATRIDVDKLDSQAPADLAGWVATIAICVALVGRRRWPLRCLAVILGLLIVLAATDNRDTVGYLALLIALYSAAAHLPLRSALRGAAMVLALVGVTLVVFDNNPAPGLIGAGAAFVLGGLIRRRRTLQEDQANEAQLRAAAEIEIAELDAAADRQRMAQELHDVVAHSLSVIAVQAGIGAHLIDREPLEAARALDAIRTTSNAAEGELERLIDVLRDGDHEPVEPAPALTGVRSLCDRVVDAGVPIELVIDGDPGVLPAGVSLAAYRIVQEALTNVVRHAGPAAATVTVRVTSDSVEICVDDNGAGVPPPPVPGPQRVGHGLVGMSERAEMYGGEATAGWRTDGGFRVHALLPMSADAIAVDGTVDGVVDGTVDGTAELAGGSSAQRPRRGPPNSVWDIALALTMAGFGVIELSQRSAGVGAPGAITFTPNDGRAWVLKLGCCLMLIGRRRYPGWTLSAAAVLATALTIGDYDVGVVVVAVLLIGLYTVGSYATTARFVEAIVGTAVTMGLVAWSDPPDLTTAGAVWTAMVATGAAVAGFLVRLDRERRDATIAAHENAGVAQSRSARLAVTMERLRIAEELDAAITLSIRSISTIAGSGSRVVETDPAAALEMLEAISVTSRDALTELRRVLKRMRTTDEPKQYVPVVHAASISTGPLR
ncbi:MAG: histidine kinase [Ilumatobacteraceae bacterium]